MEKKMYEVEVKANRGGSSIWISQEDGSEYGCSVRISVDQVDALIQWLKEAKDEILSSGIKEFPDFGGRVNGSQN